MSMPRMEFGRPCHYCNEAPSDTRDHVVPKSRGGKANLSNLVLACSECNQAKGNSWPTCRCLFCLRAVETFLNGLDAAPLKRTFCKTVDMSVYTRAYFRRQLAAGLELQL